MLLGYGRARPNQRSSLSSGYLARPENCGVEDRSIWTWERRRCGRMWVDYCQRNAPPEDLDGVIHSVAAQALHQSPHSARPAVAVDMSVEIKTSHIRRRRADRRSIDCYGRRSLTARSIWRWRRWRCLAMVLRVRHGTLIGLTLKVRVCGSELRPCVRNKDGWNDAE